VATLFVTGALPKVAGNPNDVRRAATNFIVSSKPSTTNPPVFKFQQKAFQFFMPFRYQQCHRQHPSPMPHSMRRRRQVSFITNQLHIESTTIILATESQPAHPLCNCDDLKPPTPPERQRLYWPILL
jgi:hypothetical protein